MNIFKAKVLSVIQTNSTSCMIGVNIPRFDEDKEQEYHNLTLRFDRGDKVELCGYPREYAVHNTELDGYSDTLCLEYVDCNGIDTLPKFGYEGYVSPQIERRILLQLFKDVKRQFKDKTWKDSCTPEFRKLVLTKLLKAIEVIK